MSKTWFICFALFSPFSQSSILENFITVVTFFAALFRDSFFCVGWTGGFFILAFFRSYMCISRLYGCHIETKTQRNFNMVVAAVWIVRMPVTLIMFAILQSVTKQVFLSLSSSIVFLFIIVVVVAGIATAVCLLFLSSSQ